MMPEYFDPRQLEAFVAVISIGSMTGAARALGISQPAVSRMMQDLEQQLGFKLLNRNGPRFTPTEQGVTFYEEVEQFLAGLRGLGERSRAIAAAAPRPIAISSLHSLASSVVPAALARIEPAALPSTIHLRGDSAEHIVQSVAAGAVDLGLTILPVEHPGIELHWTATVPCVALIASDHPLAARDSIRAEDLAAERMITTHNPYRLRRAIDEALQTEGFSPAAVIDNNSSAVSMALARLGLGVAIVESMTIRGLPTEGLIERPLAFSVPYNWAVITALGRPVPALVHRLIDEVERAAAEMIEGFSSSRSSD